MIETENNFTSQCSIKLFKKTSVIDSSKTISVAVSVVSKRLATVLASVPISKIVYSCFLIYEWISKPKKFRQYKNDDVLTNHVARLYSYKHYVIVDHNVIFDPDDNKST